MADKTKMPMKAAAKQILEEAGGPLRSDEITDRAIEQKLIKTSGKTPRATMAAQLSVAANKKDVFTRTRPGTYGLIGRDRKGAKSVAEKDEKEPAAA